MAHKSGQPLDTLGKGYALSQVHCSQCHEFKLPENMRVDEWHTIVPGMAWNAGLNKEDEAAVMAYLVATTLSKQKSLRTSSLLATALHWFTATFFFLKMPASEVALAVFRG